MDDRIEQALKVAGTYGLIDGDHHKMWVIDQMVRCLTGCPTVELTSKYPDVNGDHYTFEGLGKSDEYLAFVDGGWDEGIAP